MSLRSKNAPIPKQNRKLCRGASVAKHSFSKYRQVGTGIEKRGMLQKTHPQQQMKEYVLQVCMQQPQHISGLKGCFFQVETSSVAGI